jgi:pyrroloquinoline quinone biosynthesis protein B
VVSTINYNMKKICLIISLCISVNSFASENVPYLLILGVAQDAGYPQTACYQTHCMPGWENPLLRRGAVSLGLVSPNDKKKYLFEATPNFPEQLYLLEKQAPTRQYILDGIFLTHAHIGHYAGLMFLGHEAAGAKNIPVYAMPRMTTFLEQNAPWQQLVKFNNIALNSLKNQIAVELSVLKVIPFLVPHRDEYSETVGFKIIGPNKSAIFIPDINKWSQWEVSLADEIALVDYALIDATFYADGELPGRDMSKIPHPFVTETMETLKSISQTEKNKVWFIHMNHSNPLLNLNSDASKYVKGQGFNIATEGIKLDL